MTTTNVREALADERKAFEAEQIRHVTEYSRGRHHPHLDRTGDGYQNPLVHYAWQGWKARAALSQGTPSPAPQSAEPMGVGAELASVQRALEASEAACTRLIEQYGSTECGVDWSILRLVTRAALFDTQAIARKARVTPHPPEPREPSQPAPEQGEAAQLWQWRRKGGPWTLEHTYNTPVIATTDDSEVRVLYTAPQPAPEKAEAAVPAGTLTVSKFRGHLENIDFDYTGNLPDGTYTLIVAPSPTGTTPTEGQASITEGGRHE